MRQAEEEWQKRNRGDDGPNAGGVQDKDGDESIQGVGNPVVLVEDTKEDVSDVLTTPVAVKDKGEIRRSCMMKCIFSALWCVSGNKVKKLFYVMALP